MTGNAAMNMDIQIALQYSGFSSFGYKSKGVIGGSYVSSICLFFDETSYYFP